MLASVKQSQRGGSFDFYAPKVGAAVLWNQATEEQRQEARPYLRQLRDDVTALSQRYASASGPEAQEQKMFSALLLQALKVPDEDHGFILDGMPVLTFWGFMKPDSAQDEDVIGRMLDEQKVPPASAVLPSPLKAGNDSRRWWVSWLLLLLLLLLLLWLGWKNWDFMPWQPKELTSLDPHSSYLNPLELKEMKVSSRGKFGGLGVTVTMEGNFVKVISPLEGTPAFRAGLKPSDLISHLDGVAIEGKSIHNAVSLMRGKPGTFIRLTISRGDMEPFDAEIRRAIIKVKSVRGQL